MAKDVLVEPSALFSSRRAVMDERWTLTQNILFTEGRNALIAMVKSIDKLYLALDLHVGFIDFYPDDSIPDLLVEMCAHMGIATNILFNSNVKGKGESKRAYDLRIERTRFMEGFCKVANIDVSVLCSKAIRNKMIHVDEHLEKALRTPDTSWMIDSAIAYRDQFEHSPQNSHLKDGFCRTFIASEEKLLHLGEEISIAVVRRQATDVLHVIFGMPFNPPLRPPRCSKRTDT